VADSPAAERRIDEDDVRALLRAQKDSARLADLPLRKVAEGWDNAIWRLGDELAVRVPKRALASSLIRHEQRALPILGPRLAELGIRTPEPLVHGAPTEAFPWPWSVVPWIDGTPALGLRMRANTPWAPDLARALGALHRPAPADAPRNPVRGVPLAVRDRAMRTRLARLDETEPMQSAWDAGVAAAPASETVWIHGDLHPGNVLVASGYLAALIDFGDVRHVEVRGILDGAAPEGLSVDPDLRWQLLTGLATTGHADLADIDREAEADDTGSGRTAARRARASRPEAPVRAQAWRTAWDDESLSNDHLDAEIGGFRAGGRRDLISGFDDEYFARIADVWRTRSIELAQRLVVGMFPAADSLEPVDGWLAQNTDAPAALRRIVVEQRDHLARDLRVRAAQ